jgi:hypothetical protein
VKNVAVNCRKEVDTDNIPVSAKSLKYRYVDGITKI